MQRAEHMTPHIAPDARRGNLAAAMDAAKILPCHRRPSYWRRLIIDSRTAPERIERVIAVADLDALVILHGWLRERQAYARALAGLRGTLAAHAGRWGVDTDAAARVLRLAALQQVRDGIEPDVDALATEIAREACRALLRGDA